MRREVDFTHQRICCLAFLECARKYQALPGEISYVRLTR